MIDETRIALTVAFLVLSLQGVAGVFFATRAFDRIRGR